MGGKTSESSRVGPTTKLTYDHRANDSRFHARRRRGGHSVQRMVSCAWSNRESEGSCNVCQTRDDPKVLCVSLPCIGFRVCKVCAAELISKLASAANVESSATGGAKGAK